MGVIDVSEISADCFVWSARYRYCLKYQSQFNFYWYSFDFFSFVQLIYLDKKMTE